MAEMSLAELAQAIGWTSQRINWHKRKPDAPKNHDLNEWLSYLSAHSYPIAGTAKQADASQKKLLMEKMAEEKLGILQAVRHEKDRNNRIKDNLVYEAGEVDNFIRNMVQFFFGELDRMAGEYPASLKGKTEIAISQEVTRQNKIVKAALADKAQTWEQNHKRKEQPQ